MSSNNPRFGWIGLGSMGLPMAKNLQRHLSSTTPLGEDASLRYTNRTISRGVDLEKLGGTPYPSPAEVVAESDTIFISV